MTTVDELELDRQRDLLSLREHLDKVKWYEGRIVGLKETLEDPKRRKDHDRVKRMIEIAERAIVVHKQAIALRIEMIRLRGEGIEIEEQLEALQG